MGYTLCERLIANGRDMAEVERAIVDQLGGEYHRCAFLRSAPYIRLRIAALYLPYSPEASTAQVAYCGDLSVLLTPTADGPVVSVSCRHEPAYPDDFEAERISEATPFFEPCQKRMRVGE